jgi:hypothetical protein
MAYQNITKVARGFGQAQKDHIQRRIKVKPWITLEAFIHEVDSSSSLAALYTQSAPVYKLTLQTAQRCIRLHTRWEARLWQAFVTFAHGNSSVFDMLPSQFGLNRQLFMMKMSSICRHILSPLYPTTT